MHFGPMPTETVIATIGFVAAFAALGIVLAWGERRTNSKSRK
jgi:hypothetical protein